MALEALPAANELRLWLRLLTQSPENLPLFRIEGCDFDHNTRFPASAPTSVETAAITPLFNVPSAGT